MAKSLTLHALCLQPDPCQGQECAFLLSRGKGILGPKGGGRVCLCTRMPSKAEKENFPPAFAIR